MFIKMRPMNRVILFVGIGFIFAGGLASYLGSGVTAQDDLKLVDIFSIISAVATAAAAFAAWKAASAAQKQSSSTEISGRRQQYRMHFESFNEWLNALESDLKISFYRRHELYESMFPSNRNPRLSFSEIGDDEVKSWWNSFARLADKTCAPSEQSRREIVDWVGGYTVLRERLRYTQLNPAADQIRLSGDRPTGVCLENYQKIILTMGKVMASLSDFAFLDGCPGYRGMTDEFRCSFSDFVTLLLEHQWHRHRYC